MLRRLNQRSFALTRPHLAAMQVTRVMMGNKGSSSHSSEDLAELERERALREKFAQKIGGFANFASMGGGNTNTSGSSGGSSSGSGNAGGNGGGIVKPQGAFGRIFFFVTTLYMLLLATQLENPNSAISLFQGMRWWQVPLDTVSCLALMRVLLPFREQNRLKGEYEEAQKQDPNLTMAVFFQSRYPSIFQGHRASQQQLIAAVAACLASSRDMALIGKMQQTVGMARDPRLAADSIMELLYKEYPHVFAA